MRIYALEWNRDFAAPFTTAIIDKGFQKGEYVCCLLFPLFDPKWKNPINFLASSQ